MPRKLYSRRRQSENAFITTETPVVNTSGHRSRLAAALFACIGLHLWTDAFSSLERYTLGYSDRISRRITAELSTYEDMLSKKESRHEVDDLADIFMGHMAPITTPTDREEEKEGHSIRGAAKQMLSKSHARQRQGRDLSIDLGNGDCLVTPAEPTLNEEYTPYTTTFLAAFPGSGKRLTAFLVEALTGSMVGDDWDHSGVGPHKNTMIKGSYPQKESFPWHWFQYSDQTLLQLRNPRWALPSYMSIKDEIGFAKNWDEAHARVLSTYTKRADLSKWSEFVSNSEFPREVKQWGWLIDFYMERGRRRYVDSNEDILGGPNGDEPTYNFRCKNEAGAEDARLECKPVAVVSYEKLKEPSTGPTELAKIAESMENIGVKYVIDNSTWPCIWENVMSPANGRNPNRKRDGKGPPEKGYPMNSTQLFLVDRETKRIVQKYSQAEWSNDTVAQELVQNVQVYDDENSAELEQVLLAENNCGTDPCNNGGTCEVGLSDYYHYYSFRCNCPEGWTGQFCEIMQTQV